MRIPAHPILSLPWTAVYHWQGLADQAWSLVPDHRTLGPETIRVRPILPSGCGVPPQAVPGASRAALPSQPAHDPSGPLPETGAEITRIVEALLRAIRLAYATEQTYVHWVVRFARFCLMKLKLTPDDAGPAGMTAYLDYLALERNVSAATRNDHDLPPRLEAARRRCRQPARLPTLIAQPTGNLQTHEIRPCLCGVGALKSSNATPMDEVRPSGRLFHL